MEGLPDDVLLEILGHHLHVSDLVKCRLLSKKFKFLVDNFVKIQKFAFFSAAKETLYYRKKDFPSATRKQTKREPINPNHTIMMPLDRQINVKCPLLDLPCHSSFQLLCSSLRYLKISAGLPLTKPNMATLNELSKLEKLYIAEPYLSQTNLQPELNLPNLRQLYVFWFDDKTGKSTSKLVVKSKLRQLIFEQPRIAFDHLIQLKHPDQLEFLRVDNLAVENLGSIQNLRVLHCRSISESNYDLVKLLPNLEEICLQDELLERSTGRTANHLMRQRSALNRPKLKIYFLSILLNRPFEDYHFEAGTAFCNSMIEMHLRHYDQLTNDLPHIMGVEFAELVDQLKPTMERWSADQQLPLDTFGFPVGFFERTNIRLIKVTAIRNSDQSASFLKRCKWVRELIIAAGGDHPLEQSIVDLISNLYANSLYSIKIGQNDRKLDFRPFSKLKQLMTLRVTFLDLPVLYELLEKCRNLTTVCMRYGWDILVITKIQGKYEIDHRHILGVSDHLISLEDLKILLNGFIDPAVYFSQKPEMCQSGLRVLI